MDLYKRHISNKEFEQTGSCSDDQLTDRLTEKHVYKSDKQLLKIYHQPFYRSVYSIHDNDNLIGRLS